MLKITSTGQLTVRPISARLTRETNLLLKMSPYCACIMGGFTSKSKVHTDANKTPFWSDIFTFNRSQETEITLQVYSQQMFSQDSLVGESRISLSQALSTGHMEGEYPLQYKGNPAGTITMKVDWRPTVVAMPHGYIPHIPMQPMPMTYPQKSPYMAYPYQQQGPPMNVYNQQGPPPPPPPPPRPNQYYYNNPVNFNYNDNLNQQKQDILVNNQEFEKNNQNLYPSLASNNNYGYESLFGLNNPNINNKPPPINEVKLQDNVEVGFEYPKEQEMNDVEFQKKMNSAKY